MESDVSCSKEDIEEIYSRFVDLVSVHGPVKLKDAKVRVVFKSLSPAQRSLIMAHNSNIGDFLETCPRLSVERHTILLRSDVVDQRPTTPVENGVVSETRGACNKSVQTTSDSNLVPMKLYDDVLKRAQRAEEEILLLKHMLANSKLDEILANVNEKLGNNCDDILVSDLRKRIANERSRLQELLAVNLSRLRSGSSIDELAEISLIIELAELKSIVDAAMPAVLPPVVITPEHLPLLEQMMTSLVRVNSSLAENQIMLQAMATNDLLAMLSQQQNQQQQCEIQQQLQQQTVQQQQQQQLGESQGNVLLQNIIRQEMVRKEELLKGHAEASPKTNVTQEKSAKASPKTNVTQEKSAKASPKTNVTQEKSAKASPKTNVTQEKSAKASPKTNVTQEKSAWASPKTDMIKKKSAATSLKTNVIKEKSAEVSLKTNVIKEKSAEASFKTNVIKENSAEALPIVEVMKENLAEVEQQSDMINTALTQVTDMAPQVVSESKTAQKPEDNSRIGQQPGKEAACNETQRGAGVGTVTEMSHSRTEDEAPKDKKQSKLQKDMPKRKAAVKAVPVKLGKAPCAGDVAAEVDLTEEWGSDHWTNSTESTDTAGAEHAKKPQESSEDLSIPSLLSVPLVPVPTPNLIPAHLFPQKPEKNPVEITPQSFPSLSETVVSKTNTKTKTKKKKVLVVTEEVSSSTVKGFDEVAACLRNDGAKAPPVSTVREPVASRSVADICDIQLYDDDEDDDDVASETADQDELSSFSGSWAQVTVKKKADAAKTGFDRLLAKMEREFPALGSSQVHLLLEKVQEKHGGHLKGVAASQVLTEIRALIEERKNKPQVAPSAVKVVKPDLYKTQMCTMHLSGTCQRGLLCTYAHSKREMKEAQEREKAKQVAMETSVKETIPGLYKVKLCNFYKAGYCPRASRCTFAHGDSELREFSYSAMNNMRPASPTIISAATATAPSKKVQASKKPPPPPFKFFESSDSTQELDTECVICCDPIVSEQAETLECKHVFHAKCILRWVTQRNEPTCPTCRRHTNIKNGFPKLGI